jgi:hypothetical protein
MPVLWDKGFDGNVFLAAVHETGAKFLGRVKNNRCLPVLARLDDGSFLSVIDGLPVRIIEAVITVTCADGTAFTGVYRLVSNLFNPRRHPATALIRLFHERWEHESAYFALRHTMMAGRVLRSKDPVGVEQEMWSLLALYQVLRTAMVDAVETAPGTDPDRAGFTIAREAAREQLVKAAGVVTDTVDLVGVIGARVLAGLLPPRRLRVSTRKVKSPISRYNARVDDGRPLTSQNVTAIDIAVHEPPSAGPGPAEVPRVELDTVAPAAAPATGLPEAGRRETVLAFLRSQPGRPRHGREIADVLGTANINSVCVQLSGWARAGVLQKTAPATYILAA